MPFLRAIDHVQLAMPRGEEAKARSFFVDLLGMEEVQKPPVLAARGGCWFRSADVQIHLGVEEPFRPARKAHPALIVTDAAALKARLNEAGLVTVDDDAIPGVRRFYCDDCFGNRLEFISED